MNERKRRVVAGTLALAMACTLPAQAAQAAKKRHHHPAAHHTPVVQMPQDSSSLPTPTTEAGPVVSLPPPRDPIAGITVSEAKTRGIPIQVNDPAVAVARNRK